MFLDSVESSFETQAVALQGSLCAHSAGDSPGNPRNPSYEVFVKFTIEGSRVEDILISGQFFDHVHPKRRSIEYVALKT